MKQCRLVKRFHGTCHNLNLGLMIKARACKKARQERDLGGISYISGSVEECERMNPHTLKATPTWGIRILKDS